MYQKKISWAKHLDFLVLDLIMMSIAYVIAGLIRFDDEFFDTWEESVGVILIVIYIIAEILLSNYKNIMRRKFTQEIRSVSIQFIATFAVLTMVMYLTHYADQYSRLLFLYSAIIGYVLVLTERTIWKKYLTKRYNANKNLPCMLLVGTRQHVENYIEQIHARKIISSQPVGAVVLDQEMTGESIDGVPVVAGFQDYKDYALHAVVDEVVISTNDQTNAKLLADYFLELGVTVHIGLTTSGLLDELPNGWVQKRDGFVIYTASNGQALGWKLAVKRLVDIIGGLVGCLLTGIIYLFVAPKIRKADSGPVFFSQERVGKNGRVFKFYKFRSMYQDAEARKAELMAQNEMGDSYLFKMENDPRILPGIGNLIRKTSLDEFPQFWNVLKGDMSLVGTRPPTVSEFELYQPHHKTRLSFKPGITGIWQTSGRNNIIDFEEVVRMDNEYIRNWSLWLDVKLLCKTVKVVIKKEGSK